MCFFSIYGPVHWEKIIELYIIYKYTCTYSSSWSGIRFHPQILLISLFCCFSSACLISLFNVSYQEAAAKWNSIRVRKARGREKHWQRNSVRKSAAVSLLHSDFCCLLLLWSFFKKSRRLPWPLLLEPLRNARLVTKRCIWLTSLPQTAVTTIRLASDATIASVPSRYSSSIPPSTTMKHGYSVHDRQSIHINFLLFDTSWMLLEKYHPYLQDTSSFDTPKHLLKILFFIF